LTNPKKGQIIDNDLVVTWIEASPKDIDGHEVTYQVEITSSYSSNKGWVIIPGGESLSSGTISFIANTFNLPNGSDYGIRVSAVDALGLSGNAVSSGPLMINHSGLFIAKDEGTGVKSVRFKNEDDSCWSDWEPFVAEKFWKLPQSDGIKRIFVQFQDYAENISSVCDCEIVSRVLCGEGNVTDLEVFNDRLYVSFDKNGNLKEFRVLVKESHDFSEQQVNALARFDGSLYISTYTDGENSNVYKYDGKNATKIVSPPASDEKIVSMLAYNDVLYMGCLSGNIYSYISGASSAVLSYPVSDSTPLVPIERIRTDGRIMYVSTTGNNSFLTGTLILVEEDEVIEWTVIS
jgi:outer membrane protein assembly factor BamB